MTRSRIFNAAAVAGTALVLTAGCSTFRAHHAQATYPSASVNEATASNAKALTKQLDREFQAAPEQYGAVRAQVRGGTAYLFGHVKTGKERREAERMAASLPGVSRVYNNIQIGALYNFQS